MKISRLIFAFLLILPLFSVKAQENRRGSWLPDTPVEIKNCELTSFLKSLNGNFRPLVVSFNDNIIQQKSTFNEHKTHIASSDWSYQLNILKQEKDMCRFNIQFKVENGELENGGVAVAFDFKNWSRDNFVLIPAYVYNGNRFNVETNGYMAPYPQSYIYNKHVPSQLFANNPRLSFIQNEPSKIEGLTGNASTPALCFYSPKKEQAFIWLFEQGSIYGDHGIFIEENAHQDQASFIVSAPGVRELRAGFGDFSPSGDKGSTWKKGDEISLNMCLYSFKAKSKQDLYQKFFEIRKTITGSNHPRNLVPFSTTVDLTKAYKDSVRWVERPFGSFYQSGNGDGYMPGWVGFMDLYAMLATNDEISRERVIKNLSFVLDKFPCKSGYFNAPTNEKGELLETERGELPNAVLVRRNGDILYWMIKTFELLKLQGKENLLQPQWEKAVYNLAQAFVKTWKEEGEWGNYVDKETGKIVIYNSASGTTVPGGLAAASRYFNEPLFMDVAKTSARFLYNRDVVGLGFTSGACGDIMQDADSETNFGFTESLMTLYALTGEKEWLEKACHTANMSATWVLSYDYQFPNQSTIGQLGGHMAGAVWASTQNKHAAPGVCTMSADHLFKLYRATGKSCYADLLRDIIHAHAEVMETPGRKTTGMGSGTSMERIQPTDADGKSQVGMILHTSNAWTEDNGMLMGIEIPSIYIQTDSKKIYTFDHLDVKIQESDHSHIMLEIINPTPFDATVSLFSETSKEAKQPIGNHNFLNWKKIHIKSSETIKYNLSI